MDTVFNCEFKFGDNYIAKNVLLWKCINPMSKLHIDIMNENIICDNNIIYDTFNNNIILGDESIINDFSSIENKTIQSFLTFMNNKITKKQIIIVDEPNDKYTLDDIIKTFRKRINNTRINVDEITKNDCGIVITISLLKIGYKFKLIIYEQRFTIRFEGKQPYYLLKYLLTQYVEQLHDPYFVVRYVAEVLTGDPDEHVIMDLNIDDTVLELYKCLDVTIKEYTWDDTNVSCPLIFDNDKESKILSLLKQLYSTLYTNYDKIVSKHLYIIIPIIAYYVNITDIAIFVINIKHYRILMEIIQILQKEWTVEIACNLTNILPFAINNPSYTEHHHLIQQYLDIFS